MPDVIHERPPVFFCDFDGTITEEDTLVLLLERFGRRTQGGGSWRDIEDDPDLPENRKLQAEMDLLDCTLPEAINYLRQVARIRSGFPGFAERLSTAGIPLVVLSGGLKPILDTFLAPFLNRNLWLRVNDLEAGRGKWRVLPADTPRIKVLCNHCKRWHVEQARAAGRTCLYAGDGGTDFCPAERSDIVFARDGLIRHMAARDLEYHEFESFRDIEDVMQRKGLLRPAS